MKSYCGTKSLYQKSRLTALIGHPDFMTVYKQQNYMEKIMDVLEMYDGLCMAADELTSPPIFEACSKHFDSFIKLLDLYHNFPEFEVFVLQIFSHLAAHLFFESLTVDQRSGFNKSIMNLLTVYSKNEKGMPSTSAWIRSS